MSILVSKTLSFYQKNKRKKERKPLAVFPNVHSLLEKKVIHKFKESYIQEVKSFQTSKTRDYGLGLKNKKVDAAIWKVSAMTCSISFLAQEKER
jgi:hypothetical protein